MPPRPPSFTLHRTAHVGLTVSSLPRALRFWHDLLGSTLLYQNHIEFPPATTDENIIGVPAAVLDNAMLLLPDGSRVELLEYSAPPDRRRERSPGSRPCDVGSAHVALEVTGSRALIEEAGRLGWRAAAAEPQKLTRGDGSSWTAVYMFGPDGETVELLERLSQ